jgi:hypothetical protein
MEIMLKIKVILEQIIEIDVDSLKDLDMELPTDMDEIDEFIDEACYVTTSLISSEILWKTRIFKVINKNNCYFEYEGVLITENEHDLVLKVSDVGGWESNLIFDKSEVEEVI